MLSLEKSLIDMCVKNSIDILYSYGSRSKEAKELLAGKQSAINAPIRRSFLESRMDLAFLHEVDPFVAANMVRGERLYCRNALEADEF
jgi:hypothetical protein